ncbi:DNA-3-methyladenine glycosylase 2 [Glaciecola sp. 2405UD65-10]|uniref:DNA-3-methyladenine glycosylase 2 n=1 Tax=Glaciecola sp. 2405UD65-10 TaxID=3397244 RepID=UPI003B5A501E
MNKNVKVFLSYRPPYNWQQVRMFFAKRCIMGNEYVGENEIHKTLLINEVEVRITMLHIAEKFGFKLIFNAIHSEHTLEVISTIKRMFDLDASPELISQALIATGLKDEECVEGLRVPGVASPFEAICRAILGQQVSVGAAVTKVNQLFTHFAQHEQSAFPSPKLLANSDLMFLKMPAKRRQTLIDVACYFTDLEGSTFSADDLLAIKGIGPWSVNYVDLRATGNSNIWLDSDLIIKQQVAKFNALGRPLQPELAAPWRSYLTLNLWSMA